MTAAHSSGKHTFRLADRLVAARRGRFVGREAELELFRSALLATEPPFAVLHIYGPGGVGKTTLLREYARLAAESGRPVIRLDGRNITPSPPEFLLALYQALGLKTGGTDLAASIWPPDSVVLIDTCETLARLDTWLRETWLPQLPGHSLVVMAGRNPPNPAWRTDVDWADLTRIVSLRNLRPEESQSYLANRGLPAEQHPQVLALTHGHPLALSLVAEVIGQSDLPATFSLQNEPDVVRVLLERFVQDIPGPLYRLALESCALAWATTEAMLAEAVDDEAAPALFTWLRELSFVEQGPYGLFPHDLAREVLEADLRWRNPHSYRQLNQHLAAYLRRQFQQTSGIEQQRMRLDLMYLRRRSPYMQPFFDWNALDSAYAEPAQPQDTPMILAMVKRHEGETSAQIAQYWLQRQPQAFWVFRDLKGEIMGFMAHLALQEATPADLAADPAVPAALKFVQRYGPIRSGEEIVHLRFWMGRDTYQAVSSALNLTAMNTTTHWLTHPRLAWNFIVMANPDFMLPHFNGINMPRSPEADFEVDGRRYGIFSHDWRVQSALAWQDMLAQHSLAADLKPENLAPALSPPLLVLSQPEFEEAVRQALRNYTRPDLLAANPLMRSRLVVEGTADLQTLLREAAASLNGNPKDEKLYRALYHTYFDPAPTQERAAELLNLPFSTYRYHLTTGLDRLTAWLWRRELYGLAG